MSLYPISPPVDDAGSVFDISFTDSSVDPTPASATVTFTTQAIGAAASDRHMIITIARQSTPSITSITIGGVSCSEIALTANDDNFSSIWITDSPVTSGTTATVVLLFSATPSQCGIGLLRMVGGSNTPSATDTDVTNSAAMTCTATVPAGGGYVCSARSGNGGTYTWTDDDTTTPTEAFDEVVEGNQVHSGAFNNTATLQTSLTVTALPSSTTTEQGMCMATFAPL